MTPTQSAMFEAGQFLARASAGEASAQQLFAYAKQVYLSLEQVVGVEETDAIRALRRELATVLRFEGGTLSLRDVDLTIRRIYRYLGSKLPESERQGFLASDFLWYGISPPSLESRVQLLETTIYQLIEILSERRIRGVSISGDPRTSMRFFEPSVFSVGVDISHSLLDVRERFDSLDRKERVRDQLLAELLAESVLTRATQRRNGPRYEPINVYVGTDDFATLLKLSEQVSVVASLLGYRELFSLPLEFGSILKRTWAWIDNVTNRGELIENTVAAVIDTPRANRDLIDAQTAKTKAETFRTVAEAERARAEAHNANADRVLKLTQAAESIGRTLNTMEAGSVIQVGPLVISKPHGAPPIARVLDEERADWEKNTSLAKDPAGAAALLDSVEPPKKR